MKRLLTALTVTLGLTLPAAADPSFWGYEWPKTNFDKTTVENWAQILSGGPPKDGIPAIDDPQFMPQGEDTALEPRESVITVALDGQPARAYPLRYLMWHEIVNDRIGDTPVAVTYCPLCNSAIVFDRRIAEGELSFGVSGKLRHSDMVMYDRETESWWQQALGTAIVGDLTGRELTQLPVWMESWSAFRAAHPDGVVMAEPNFPRAYGQNPYRSYDTSHRPFLYSGENPPHGIAPLMRVVRVGDAAWTFDRLREEGQVTENGVTISWEDEQASALDTAAIGQGRAVGAIRVRDGQGRDVAHDVMFAFAFHAFWPDGRWMVK
ncbi:DUF3179 domain-containing protein [Thalassovita mediterranea]|jgi:hypothetical protein|uniref:DUF3179 domain-containing protein n=1 Tax=Thalassovita mediterranea TaxID=340021 RepID=A0A0P1HD55_9RHOB|nr:DUF3179 domain-containing protein [Thalassovita mediterranea]CUH84802.1 hypothetical protein TM5383_02020 [Thalassovita mediterranea]SIS29321.1 Protein of unknown function [Thalassovita mediterranea]